MTYSASKCLRAVALAVIAVCLSAPGCGSVRDILDGVEKPQVRLVDASIRDLALDHVMLGFDVEVSNPYSLSLPVAALEYALASGGTPFLSGKSEETTLIPAGQSRTLPLVARVGFSDLMSVLSKVRPGARVPYAADLGISVDAPGIGPLTLPLRHEGELPVPTVPDVSVESVRWDSLSLNSASAVAAIRMKNTNDFALDLAKFAYGLDLAGVNVAGGQVSRPPSFAPGEEHTIEIPFSVSPISLGMAAFQALRGSSTDYGFTGGFDVGTPFGKLAMPFSTSGRTPLSSR